MSMYRLTQLTGVSGHHIKGIEEGTRQPTIETLNRLAVALGSSLAEMFNDDTECTYLTEKERHLIENFRRLSDEKAEASAVPFFAQWPCAAARCPHRFPGSAAAIDSIVCP